MNRVTDLEELDEEEMLKMAIAMSLQKDEEEEEEEEEEQLLSVKGELLKKVT